MKPMLGSGEAAVSLGGGTSMADGDGVAGSVGSGEGSVGDGSVVGVVGGGSLGTGVVGGGVDGGVVAGLFVVVVGAGAGTGLPPTPGWTTQAARGGFGVLDVTLGAGVGLGVSDDGVADGVA